MKRLLILTFTLIVVGASSCKREINFSSAQDEMKNDPLLQKYLKSVISFNEVVTHSLDLKAYKLAKKNNQNKEFIKQIQEQTSYNGLTLKQAQKNQFYYTSILYKKYVLSGKMSKIDYLKITKEEREKILRTKSKQLT